MPWLEALRSGLAHRPGGADAGSRKLRLFDDQMLTLARQRLANN